MSLEKQIEQLNKSIGDLIGAVDANTKVVVALLEASSPNGAAASVKAVSSKAKAADKEPEPEQEVEEAEAEEVTEAEVVEEEPGGGDSGIDVDTLKAAFVKLVKTHDRKAMEDILGDFKAAKISDLEPAEYPEVMAAVKEKMEA